MRLALPDVMSTRAVRGTAALALLMGVGCKQSPSESSSGTTGSAALPENPAGDASLAPSATPGAPTSHDPASQAEPTGGAVGSSASATPPAQGTTVIIVMPGETTTLDAGAAAIDAGATTGITAGGAGAAGTEEGTTPDALQP